MTENVIDQVTNELIANARKAGNGFVLGLDKKIDSDIRDRIQKVWVKIAAATQTSSVEDRADLMLVVQDLLGACTSNAVEVRQVLPPVDEYMCPSDGRMHTIGDTESFIAYTTRYGTKEKSMVIYNQEQAVLVIDELVERGTRELIKMPFTPSQEWSAWSAIVSRPLTHKQLYQHLLLWSDTLEDPTLLNATRTMRVNVQVKHESDLQEDSESIGFFIKASKGEEMLKFPKQIKISLPVLDQDDAANETVSATLRLEIDLPTKPDGQTAFTLHCPRWRTLLRHRIDKEAAAIEASLDGYTVVCGTHETFERAIGRFIKD